jgi:hypothetical protein
VIEIVQKRFCKPTQTLRLTDDDYLEVEIKRLLREGKFKLNLRDFYEVSSHQKVFKKKPFALTVIFGILTIALLVIALIQKNHSEQMGLFEFTGVVLGCFIFSGLVLWFTRADYLKYDHRLTKKAILTPYFNLPDKASFQNFITALDARLKSIHNPDRIGFQ